MEFFAETHKAQVAGMEVLTEGSRDINIIR